MKRISPGTVTVGVFAIVFGLVAAYVVRHVMNQEPEKVVERVEPTPPEPTVSVVIARQNIEKHARITMSDLDVVRVPQSQELPEGILKRREIALDRIAKVTLKAGQAVKEEMLLGIGERLPSVADQLPAGMRALTIAVSNLDAHLLEAGAEVDIAMSIEGDHPDLGELATRTLMRRIKVIDVASPSRAQKSLTVAVSPMDANKLINAQQAGTLTVALCSPNGQDAEAGDHNITRRELLGLAEVPPAPAPKVFKVERWEGSKMQTLELGEERIDEALKASASMHKASAGFVSSGGQE